MLQDAGYSGQRWSALIDALPMLGPQEYDAIVSALQELDLEQLNAVDQATMWKHLRKLVADHRSFVGADWAMAPQVVDRVDELRDRFEPPDHRVRFGWLFDGDPYLTDATPVLKTDWHARQAALEAKRIDALEIVLESTGIDGIFSIADGVEQPGVVGWSAASIPAISAMEDEILEQQLASSDEKRRAFGRGFANARARDRGAVWVTAKLRGIAAAWPARDRAEFLHLLEPGPETWTLAAGLGEDVEQAF